MDAARQGGSEPRNRRAGDSVENQRLEAERVRLATAIDQASEAILITDPAGTIQFVNPAFERLTGYSRSEAIGQNPRILKSGAQDSAFYKAMWAMLERGETWRGSFVNRARDGRLFEEDATISPVFDSAGSLINYVGVKRDVTREHEAERVRRESDLQFRTIFDSVSDGVAISEPGGTFLEVNRALCNRLGYTREQLLKLPVSAINTAASAATIPGRVRDMLAGRESPAIEATHVRADGSEIAVEAVSCRIEFRGRPAILSVYRDITERKRTEAALREQSRLMQALLDALPITITAKGLDRRLQLVNAAFADAPGRSSEEMVGKTYRELGLADPDLHEARDDAVTQGGVAQTYESDRQFRDGSVRRMLLTKAPLLAANGEIAGIVTAGVDISDRYRAEQALRQSEDRFRTLFDFAGDAIFISEPGGKFIEVNRAACERLGYTREQLLAMSPAEIDTPEFARRTATRRDEILRRGSASFETEHLTSDGVVLPVEVRSTLIELSGREAILSIARDIGEHKRAQEALSLSEARFRTLIEEAPIAISVSRDGIGLYANRKFLAMFGVASSEEAVGRPISEYFAPEFRVESKERTRRRALGLSVPLEWESIGLRADGSPFPVHVALEQVQLPDGGANLGFVSDLTERKAAEQAHEQAQELLRQAAKEEDIGRLAGGIAHDFNNLLTAIRGSAEMALLQLPPGEGPREDLEQIEQAADRAAALTRQLLAFARRTMLQPEIVDLGAIVRRLEPMLSRLIGEDITLVTVTPRGAGSVLADPSKIEQVIVNLVVNARDAMPAGGTLTIETAASSAPSASGPTTTLSVTDTGVGMEAEVQAHLFEPFYTTKGPGRGTGLGLATAQGIVRQSGGTITVQSELGVGSTFTIHLPRVTPGVDVAPEPEPAMQAAAGLTPTGTILLVEDDGGVRSFASRVLELAGYRVVVAADGATAIELATAEPIQLLLTDIVMPGISGHELATRLTSLQPGVRVVYMSGHSDRGIVKDGVLVPGIDFLPKPFDTAALLEAVRRAMARAGGR
jgi:PAS domain S-box-containing protein